MVTILLLVAIAVTMGLVMLAFANGALSSLGGGFGVLASNRGNAVAENFVVEQAAFCLTSSCASTCSPTCTLGASLYVRNVGTISSTLVSVYIVDQSVNAFVKQVAISQVLGVGAIVDIPQSTLSFTPSQGHSYSFIVTSSFGDSVTFNEMAN
ncbi:MAG: hypothetical protein OK442_03170 [Thaumarchaeota archaeon]|nr:hypothetical protein [Nitrososphaerota archaeon]